MRLLLISMFTVFIFQKTFACFFSSSSKTTDGGWGHWSKASDCTVTCGTGIQFRDRICDSPRPNLGGQDCYGRNTEISFCQLQECPIDGDWNTWESWSSCTTSCGGGYQFRKRICNNPPTQNGGEMCAGNHLDITFCNLFACPIVNGGWGHWSEFHDCSVTCGQGNKTRSRVCDTPKPNYGGSDCTGHHSEITSCQSKSECP